MNAVHNVIWLMNVVHYVIWSERCTQCNLVNERCAQCNLVWWSIVIVNDLLTSFVEILWPHGKRERTNSLFWAGIYTIVLCCSAFLPSLRIDITQTNKAHMS